MINKNEWVKINQETEPPKVKVLIKYKTQDDNEIKEIEGHLHKFNYYDGGKYYFVINELDGVIFHYPVEYQINLKLKSYEY